MFYTLEHPAPVYGCENFSHQEEFLTAADGERRQVFFPESAWWLGFDINLPLALPITGFSRAYDIQEVLPAHDVIGHVTFTTGREWAFWQYDHFLTRISWDTDFGWSDYLAWIEPLYGSAGPIVHETLQSWTDLQVEHFYETDPLIYFYLAGEQLGDEVGERAGVVARRPKRPYREVFEMDAAAFATWSQQELGLLATMRDEYQAVLDGLPESLEDGTARQVELYDELHDVLTIYVWRIEHAIAVYEAVTDSRDWRLEQEAAAAADPPREPDTSIRDDARSRADAELATARAITADVLERIAERESHYRYPLTLVAEQKPESLTSYPFGYLWETHTGHFWVRREEQLERFLDTWAFDESQDAWQTEPDLLFLASGARATLLEPDDPLASTVITSFIGQLLFGAVDYDAGAATMGLLLGQDSNENLRPDESTDEVRIDGTIDSDIWSGDVASWALVVRDATDEILGALVLKDITISIGADAEAGRLAALDTADLQGGADSASLIELVVAFGGIDREGATNILRSVFGVSVDDPMPETLPIRIVFELQSVE